MKNYLKLGILLFGVNLFLNSCLQEEENITIEKETKFFKMLYSTRFSKIKNKKIVKKTTKKLLLRDFSKTDFENGFVIDTTSVQVLVSDYYTNYTFVANLNSANNTFLNNYVLTIFNDSIYHQMLISYPIITNGDEISYDTDNSIAEEIDGDMLIQKSGCNGYETTEWVDGVGHNCDAGGNHPPGTPCNDGIMRSWTEPGSWVTTCIQYTRITDAPPGGNPINGGGTPNDPLYNIADPYDGNIIIGATPFKGDFVISITQNECEKIKNYLDGFPSYKGQLNTLATAASTLDHEISISYSTSTPPIMTIMEGEVGSGGIAINPNPSEPYATIAHIHDNYGLDGSGTYSVPSFEDLRLFAEILFNNKLEAGSFTAFLSTANGTHFALTINDPSKFKDLFYSKHILYGNIDPNNNEQNQKWRASNLMLDNLKWEYYDHKNPDRKIKESEPSSENENQLKHFLSFLEKGDTGISIFETDENFDDFTEVTLDPLPNMYGNTQIIRKPCN